jgi:hypothetical protein
MGPEEKFATPTSFPSESSDSTWTYFYRRATDAGKERPYFYDIELKPHGDYVNKNGFSGCFAVGTWHGKPGRFMWRNYLWTFDSMEEARKKVKSLVKARASFEGGPFLKSDVSCRRGLPEEEGGEGGGEGGEEAPRKKKQKTAR